MFHSRLKSLREQKGLSQAELAKLLGVTRSSVNSYEQNNSLPSTQHVIKLAYLFKVSTDFLLGVDDTATIDVSGLSDKSMTVVHTLIEHLRECDFASSDD